MDKQDILKNTHDLNEISSMVDSINHLESILIEKKRYRKEELEKLRRDYELLIQAYSNIILKLLSN